MKDGAFGETKADADKCLQIFTDQVNHFYHPLGIFRSRLRNDLSGFSSLHSRSERIAVPNPNG